MWFTEAAWPPILVCAVLGILFAFAANNRGNRLFAMLALAMIPISIVIWLVEGAIVTDGERIETSIHEMVRAFQEKRGDDCVAFVSAQASKPPYEQIKSMILIGAGTLEMKSNYRITDYSCEFTNAESRAITRFRVNANLKEFGPQRTYWEFTWQREGDQWRVLKISYLDFLSGDERPIPSVAGGRF